MTAQYINKNYNFKFNESQFHALPETAAAITSLPIAETVSIVSISRWM
jgi:hypothetical protein